MAVKLAERAFPAAPAPAVLEAMLAKYEAEATGDESPRKAPAGPANGVYYRETVRKTEDMEIASFLFFAGTSTVLHGHAEAAVLLKAMGGVLMEEGFIPVYCSSASGCVCSPPQLACRYEYIVRSIKAGVAAFLPVGAYHRVHCLETGPTFNVYHPRSSDPVAPVPPPVMLKLLTAKHDYLKVFHSISRAPMYTKFGAFGIDSIVRTVMDSWAAREAQQNCEQATMIHPATIADFRSTGVLASPIPIEFGGCGDKLAVVVASLRKLAAVAPATALSLAMPLGNAAASTIPQSAVPEEHREALGENTAWIVKKIVEERKILAVANSEPGSGGEIKCTQTTATLKDGLYRLTGNKSFATIGPDSDYFMCAAKRDDAKPGDVDGFFVAKDNLTLDTKWDPLGMRPTASVGLRLEDSAADAMLGFPGSLSGVNARHWSTLMFTAVFVGVAEGALKTLALTLDPAAKTNSYVRSTVALLALQIDAAAGMLETLAAIDCVPLTQTQRERCNNAKSFAAKTAVDTATSVSMLSGGRAYKANHTVSQILHDSLAAPLLRPPFPKVVEGLAAKWLDNCQETTAL